MIVLDDERIACGGKPEAQLVLAFVVDRRTGRILRAWGQQNGSRAAADGALEPLRLHAALVDRDRLRNETERTQQIEVRGVDGIFDGNAIPGAQVCSQRALDAVERASHDGDGAPADAVG